MWLGPLVAVLGLARASPLLTPALAPSPFNRTQIEDVFINCFKDTFCLEIFADDSRSTEELLHMLHDSENVPSLYYYEVDHILCRDRLFISRSINTLWPILWDNRSKEVRFFLFLVDFPEEILLDFLYKFQTDSGSLEYAAGHIINLNRPDIVYSYNIVQNRFLQQNTAQIKPFEKDVVDDFGGKTLKVATFNCSIHSEVGPLDESGRPAYIGGAELRFFHMLSGKLNFSYRIVAPRGTADDPEDLVGGVTASGALSEGGIVGLVGRREADIGFCAVVSSGRLRRAAIDVTDSPTWMCVKFLVPRRGVVAKRGSGLIKPFEAEVWLLVAGSLLATPLLVQLFARFIRPLHPHDLLIQSYTSFENAFIQIWGILLTNSPKSLSRMGPLRHLICSWALMGYLIGIFYTCSLRTTLLSLNRGENFNTIPRMAQSQLSWVLDHKVDMDFFFDMEDPWHQMWSKKFKLVNDLEELCQLVKERNVAILAHVHTKGVLSYPRIPCSEILKSYKTSTECLLKINTVFLLQHNSPYTKIFSTYIKKLNENGIFRKEYDASFHLLSLREPYVLEALKSTTDVVQGEVKLGLYNMASSLFIPLVGGGLGLLVFILELLWHRKAPASKCLSSEQPSCS